MEQDAHITAHERSSRHRAEIEASTQCGCFYCLAVFASEQVRQWCDNQSTARCPKCGIDSVIGDASGYPIDQQFLTRMNAYWF